MDKRLKGKLMFMAKVVLATTLFLFYTMLFNRVELHAAGMEYPAVNFFAPDFELPTLNGEKLKLADFRGKVVFINFWATWCVTCKLEMASIEKLYQRFKDRDFVALAISVDKDVSKIRPYLEENNLTFPVLLDSNEAVKNKYKFIGLPATYIVDKNGIILHKAIGPRDWFTKEMIENFNQLVHGD